MSRSLHWWAICLPLLALLPGINHAAEKKSAPGDRLFDNAQPVQIHLTLTEKQFAALAPAGGAKFGPPGFGPPRKQAEGTHRNTFGVDFPWSQGDLTFDGKTLKDVGIRYKGNYTFMATAQSLKKSLKVDLNKNVKGQKLDGLSKINLHCGVSDGTLTREVFSYTFFRNAGVPTPRASYAELTLTVPGKHDKEFVGIYTLVEQVNKDFLKKHFKDGSGMLLKPEGLQGGLTHFGSNWRAYEGRYKPDRTPTEQQQKRLIDFTKMIGSGTDEEFAKEIGNYLDIEAFLNFIATNTLLSNMDSYLGYGHNYYLYLIPGTNKFAFIPWDLDLSLATWPAVGTPEQLVELSINHPHAGDNKLIDRLFAIKEHKERYLAILKELTSNTFTKEKLLASLNEMEKLVKGPLAKEAKAVASRKEGRGGKGFGMGFGGKYGQTMPPQKFIEKRTQSVAAQLAGKSKGFEPKAFGFGFGPPPRGFSGPGKKDR